AHRLVGVTDVLGHQGEQDLFLLAIRKATGQSIEQKKEGSLPPGGDAHVFFAQGPAKSATKEMGYRLSQGGVSCRRLVVAEHMLKLTRSCHDFREPRAPQGVYLRNVGRLAASQHQDFVPARSESMAQVVHQFADTAALTQALAKNGKLPRTDFRI